MLQKEQKKAHKGIWRKLEKSENEKFRASKKN